MRLCPLCPTPRWVSPVGEPSLSLHTSTYAAKSGRRRYGWHSRGAATRPPSDSVRCGECVVALYVNKRNMAWQITPRNWRRLQNRVEPNKNNCLRTYRVVSLKRSMGSEIHAYIINRCPPRTLHLRPPAEGSGGECSRFPPSRGNPPPEPRRASSPPNPALPPARIGLARPTRCHSSWDMGWSRVEGYIIIMLK